MYAGFWKRFVAYLIDYALLTVVIYILALILGMTAGIGSAAADADESGIAALMSVFGGFFLMLFILLPWLYYSLMESSVKRATLGKMALGIRVTDYGGNRISFGRATGRYFAKIISSLILLIGYIMAGFTEKKQALHDMIAGTLVVSGDFEPGGGGTAG
jgi:uncharacterized RDD family membrane protein YckC